MTGSEALLIFVGIVIVLPVLYVLAVAVSLGFHQGKFWAIKLFSNSFQKRKPNEDS